MQGSIYFIFIATLAFSTAQVTNQSILGTWSGGCVQRLALDPVRGTFACIPSGTITQNYTITYSAATLSFDSAEITTTIEGANWTLARETQTDNPWTLLPNGFINVTYNSGDLGCFHISIDGKRMIERGAYVSETYAPAPGCVDPEADLFCDETWNYICTLDKVEATPTAAPSTTQPSTNQPNAGTPSQPTSTPRNSGAIASVVSSGLAFVGLVSLAL